MLSGKSTSILFFSLILSYATLALSAGITVKEDKGYALNVGDTATFECAGPAAGKDSIRMYKYNLDGTYVEDDKSVVNLKKDAGSNTWTCSAEYSKTEVNATVDIIKEGDTSFAPSSPVFQCAAASKARIFCQVTKSKPSSAFSIKGTSAFYSFVAVLGSFVLLSGL